MSKYHKDIRRRVRIHREKLPLSEEIAKALKNPWWYLWGVWILFAALFILMAASVTFGAICAIHGGWEWGP